MTEFMPDPPARLPIQTPDSPFGVPVEWQPIATAPKDGARLLLWCGEIEIGYWSTSSWVTISEGAALPAQSGAWIIYENRSDTVELRPTHWMPLPPAPK